MNPMIVTIIVALATFIVSIFSVSWLNQQAMNERIDDLRSYLDARFAAQDTRIERQLEVIFKLRYPPADPSLAEEIGRSQLAHNWSFTARQLAVKWLGAVIQLPGANLRCC